MKFLFFLNCNCKLKSTYLELSGGGGGGGDGILQISSIFPFHSGPQQESAKNPPRTSVKNIREEPGNVEGACTISTYAFKPFVVAGWLPDGYGLFFIFFIYCLLFIP